METEARVVQHRAQRVVQHRAQEEGIAQNASAAHRGAGASPRGSRQERTKTKESTTMTTPYICVTCGTQFTATEHAPERCPICEDERQYVGWDGQRWTTLEDLARDYHNVIRAEEPGLTGIGTHPSFAIGQRALLVQAPGGNILWDCISLLDEPTIAAVRALGGIAAIAISHPHYYSCMVEWAHAFDAPVYLHAADRAWVMRPDPALVFWEGEARELGDGLTLLHCGGHFAGGTVLHWAAGGHRAAHRGRGRAVHLRPPLWRVVGAGRDDGGQGRGAALGGAVHRGTGPRGVGRGRCTVEAERDHESLAARPLAGRRAAGLMRWRSASRLRVTHRAPRRTMSGGRRDSHRYRRGCGAVAPRLTR
jgi:hypothetical protein